MEINKDKRIELYKKATPVVQDLYGAQETGRLIWDLEKKLGISTEEESTTLALTVGDIILGLYKKEQLAQLLKDRMSFSEEQIKTAETTLEPLLSKVPETSSPTNASVIQVPDPATPEPPPPTKPAEENPANVVKPLRTFAMDADISRAHSYGSFQSGDSDEKNEDEPVHRSSQDDIIKK